MWRFDKVGDCMRSICQPEREQFSTLVKRKKCSGLVEIHNFMVAIINLDLVGVSDFFAL